MRSWQLDAWVSADKGHTLISYMQLKRNDADSSSSRKLALGYVHGALCC